MIYVDELTDRGWQYGANSHMSTDDISEVGLEQLHAMAERIGLKRSYYQPSSFPHYDLNARMYVLAVKAGAIPVPSRELGRMRRGIRRQMKERSHETP